jgi:soluble lytic murein transglycosylase-like protein
VTRGATRQAPRRWVAVGAGLILVWVGGSLAAAPPCPKAPRGDLDAAIAAGAARTGLPPGWIGAVIDRESAGYPCAVSPKGAMGLMQLMPDTWASLRAALSLGASPFDIRDNVLAGAAYLRVLHDRFGPAGMLAAYNAGPGRYLAAVSNGRPLPAETIAYVSDLAPRLSSGGAVAGGSTLPAGRPGGGLFAGLPVATHRDFPSAEATSQDDGLFVVLAPHAEGAP